MTLEFIWQTIRQHFGFQVTGAHFIDFSDIHLEADKRPEDLFQRLNGLRGRLPPANQWPQPPR